MKHGEGTPTVQEKLQSSQLLLGQRESDLLRKEEIFPPYHRHFSFTKRVGHSLILTSVLSLLFYTFPIPTSIFDSNRDPTEAGTRLHREQK
jgi:hypothetical protein